jgi:hypothetical protein
MISAEEADAIFEALYDSEINFSITTFWDAGLEVKLGDEMNGFKSISDLRIETMREAAEWLRAMAMNHYPDSYFAKLFSPAPG